MTECQAKHIDLAAFPTDWADLQAFYTSIMDVGSHGCVGSVEKVGVEPHPKRVGPAS